MRVKFDVYTKHDQVHIYPYIEIEKRFLFIKYKEKYDLLKSNVIIVNNFMFIPSKTMEVITGNPNDIFKVNSLSIGKLNSELKLHNHWSIGKNSLFTLIKVNMPIEKNVKQINEDIEKIKEYIINWFKEQMDNLEKHYKENSTKEEYLEKFKRNFKRFYDEMSKV
jgi:hypothetical protein